MSSISQQIRRIQLKQSPEQIARTVAEARRKQAAFRAKVSDQRPPGSTMDPAFLKQLEAKRAAVAAGAPPKPRADLPGVIAQLKLEGKLPTPEGEQAPVTSYSMRDALRNLMPNAPKPADKVGYEPTPEEILGDEAKPSPSLIRPPKDADEDCPPADEVLRGSAAEGANAAPVSPAYGPGDLSPEEVAEIDRLNPRGSQGSKTVARTGPKVHTAKRR